MRSRTSLFPALMLLAACGGGEGGERLREAPPAAAVLAPADRLESLDVQLQELDVELEAALGGELDRLLRAEAITDRLMEARRPVDWLASGYDVEARLRQLQAMADRVVAMLRRGATLETVEEDVSTIRVATRDLRTRIREPGGGPAPPPLDSLLQQDPLRDVRSPAATAAATESDDPADETSDETSAQPAPATPARRGPLGTPVTRDTTGN